MTLKDDISWAVGGRSCQYCYDPHNRAIDDIFEEIRNRIDILKQECNGNPDSIDAYNKVKEILK